MKKYTNNVITVITVYIYNFLNIYFFIMYEYWILILNSLIY